MKASACGERSWWAEEESHSGGASIFEGLEYGSGVKRQRRRDCSVWTKMWKWPSSLRRWVVRIAFRREHRWR